MTDRVRIQLQPAGETFEVERGAALQDVLFAHGVEFPCGGRGQCKGCRVKVLQGRLSPASGEEHVLSEEERAEGWRLACLCRAEEDLTLELAQWKAPILADETPFDFTPREGLGVAVDIGTTTVAAQLLDMPTGRVLAVRTALNPQARHGADLMTRIEFATAGGAEQLRDEIRAETAGLIAALIQSPAAGGRGVRDVTVVGNTAMHHFFCGIDAAPLAAYPFEPVDDGLKTLTAKEMGWDLDGGATARFLPCIGGFVGSDVLAGVLSTEMHNSDSLVGLVDLGTNGEIVLGDRNRMVCASTAAGPAFEGALISSGMRAATGAIARVTVRDGHLECHTLGDVEPRGICGSGLVDAVASGLEIGAILPNGRLAGGAAEMPLAGPVSLTQGDVRQLQLAKGAIAAGIRILLDRLDANPSDVSKFYLSGAFGNYVNYASARRIGLIDFPAEKVLPVGNSALLGAKLALFEWLDGGAAFQDVIDRIEHVPLNADPEFQDIYVEEMTFPDET
jgi:uncharacterized 2Fe-2S/4Fe-4S cluster protein (DUF4445 family)